MNIEEINAKINKLEQLRYRVQKEQEDELIEKNKDYIGKYYKSTCNSIGRIEYLEVNNKLDIVLNAKDISLYEGDMISIDDEIFMKDDITIISKEEFIKLYKKMCNELIRLFDENIMEDDV